MHQPMRNSIRNLQALAVLIFWVFQLFVVQVTFAGEKKDAAYPDLITIELQPASGGVVA